MIAQVILLLLLRPHADPIHEPAIRSMCWSLLGKARFGFAREEQAAFVVRGDDGRFSLVEWPSNGLADCAGWQGALPRGAVGIVHTHPNWLPMPSRIDVQTASRARMPVYVITRERITRTDGSDAHVVLEGEWSRITTEGPRDS